MVTIMYYMLCAVSSGGTSPRTVYLAQWRAATYATRKAATFGFNKSTGENKYTNTQRFVMRNIGYKQVQTVPLTAKIIHIFDIKF
jgi:hypothetical protein